MVEQDHGPPVLSGFARLAARISSWTTRALVTLMILVAALAVGRQTIEWWHAEPPEAAAARQGPPVAEGVGDPGRAHVLELGQSPWVMLRQSLAGTEEAALEVLEKLCQQSIGATQLLSAPASGEEKAFLATLEKVKPAAESPGQWTLYRVPAGFPIVVGVRPVPSDARSGGQHVAVSACRVVTWAVAAPAAKDRWTLYVFYPEKGAGDSASSPARVAVPPGTSPTLGIRVLGGGAVIGFKGRDDIPAWTQFYDQWFSRRGWSSSGWQTLGTAWHACYTSNQPGRQAADVRIGSDGNGQATGLVVVSGG